MEFLLIALMIAAFWLLLIRPNQQRQKAARELQESLAVGDRVMLSSGIYGTVIGLGDSSVNIEIAPGTAIEVARGAVATVIRDDADSARDNTGDEPTEES